MTAPIILLSKPQMPENIGAVARAMGNFALSELRLIAPREGKPAEKAYSMASGADKILDDAILYDEFADSVADIQFLMATTARRRDMEKPAYTPRQAMALLQEKRHQGLKCGLLFGGERAGLDNQEIIYADALIHIPTNPDFSSLNLAQAVLLVGYEYLQTLDSADIQPHITKSYPVASKQELDFFYHKLETVLEEQHFFYPPEKKPSMIQIIRNIFARIQMNEQEIRTMHGIIKALMGYYKK